MSNINLTVDDGKFVVVTGPNGGGKSTLAKLIAGIESPASGSIFMEGHDITDMSISERAKMELVLHSNNPSGSKGFECWICSEWLLAETCHLEMPANIYLK